MKIKQHLYISNPEQFAKGNYGYCFMLLDHISEVNDWIYVGKIELDVDIDRNHAVLIAEKQIDETEAELKAKYEVGLKELDRRRQELLALPNPENSNESNISD